MPIPDPLIHQARRRAHSASTWPRGLPAASSKRIGTRKARLGGSLLTAIAFLLAGLATQILLAPSATAQMGGGMGGGGMGGGGAAAPSPDNKVKFRDHIHTHAGMTFRRERGDAIVENVRIVGNTTVNATNIFSELQTRKGRFYDSETVMADVRRLNDMGSFDQVTFDVQPAADENPSPNPNDPAPRPGVVVTFFVHERPMVKKVIFHGNYAMNDREITNRVGVAVGDPLSPFSVESGRRRLVDYYLEEGFNQVAVATTITGLPDSPPTNFDTQLVPPGSVIFRINEGPKERIADIQIEGSTIVSESRLKKIITSRGPMAGVVPWLMNTADMKKIDNDVNILSAYYHSLGFLTATVGRRLHYDESGKWVTVVFVIKEGPRFTVGDVQIVGNEYITEESLRRRMELNKGDMFDGTLMRRDVGEIVYGYGELGFIYAEVQPKTIMRDENGIADLVYEITEGDRWKIGRILVNIDGEPHLMRETTMLNLVDMREGDWIDRRTLELSRRRIERSQLLETNPMVAEPPDIKVVPREDMLR